MNAARIALAAHRVHDPSNPRRGEPRTMDSEQEQAARSAAWLSDPARAGGGNHLTDDLRQVAAVAVWRAQEKHDGRLDPALAYTVARRACIDLLRKEQGRDDPTRQARRTFSIEKWREDGAADLADLASRAAPGPDADEGLWIELDRAIDAMPNWKHRLIAREYLVRGVPLVELAGACGYTLNSVHAVWAQEVRRKLRAALAAYDPRGTNDDA